MDEACRSPALCSDSSPGTKGSGGLKGTSRFSEPQKLETLGCLFLLQVGLGVVELRLNHSCAQSHRASRGQSLAWNSGCRPLVQDSFFHDRHSSQPVRLCRRVVFIQVDSSWGPVSHCRPRVCWGGNSKLLIIPQGRCLILILKSHPNPNQSWHFSQMP